MHTKLHKDNTHPIVQLVKNLVHKFMQTPDIYPIRYYKKAKGLRRF